MRHRQLWLLTALRQHASFRSGVRITFASGMKRRKKKVIDVGKEARRVARKSGIAPAATRVIPDRRKRAEKHKKQWLSSEIE
jgi:hypothetical protein